MIFDDVLDGLVVGVRVPGRHHADEAAGGRVLVHLDDVRVPGEARGLVHVLHGDLDRGIVLELEAVDEPGVQVGVPHLHSELKVPLAFIIQCLEIGKEQEN